MITEIRATARISFKQPTKQGDVFYTFEYGETESGDFLQPEQYEQSRQALWNRVNNEVGNQVTATINQYRENTNAR